MTLFELILLICMVTASTKPEKCTLIVISPLDSKEVIQFKILEYSEKNRVVAVKQLSAYLATAEGEINISSIMHDEGIKQMLHQGINQDTLDWLSHRLDSGQITILELSNEVEVISQAIPGKMQEQIAAVTSKIYLSDL